MIINNQDSLLVDELNNRIQEGSEVCICVNFFTFNALFDLAESIRRAASVKVLVNRPHLESQQKDFVNFFPENGTNSKLTSRYRMQQAVRLLRDRLEVRKGDTGGMSFVIVDNVTYQIAPNSLAEPTLGIIKDGRPYMIFKMDDTGDSAKDGFNNFWSHAANCKDTIMALLEQADTLKHPELVYRYTIAKIFEDKTTEDINEDRLQRTGFKNSVVWSKLFNFQRDAVLGAIDKIERYNGCIIADSVGLGKTFEALAVIKYYELRNDRVLVLAPKKLRENWITYTKNYQTNILEKDRFNYDVLNHTDLTRDGGLSGDIELNKVNWGNYDLVVIDESHNFRNNNPGKSRISRYEKLMRDVIQAGVRTKVLLLSATPVNTRLNDLKNQLAFITESNDGALAKGGIGSIELALTQAQRKFNAWLKEHNPTRDGLINRLNGDYFKLLDIFTISRSRKHIEKYYDVAEIGKFPTRLKPISKYSDFDTQNPDFNITNLNEELGMMNLQFYSPMFFVADHKKQAYADLYDTKTERGTLFSQAEREESIITLMRVNLLKRLESSIHSFCLTLGKILHTVDGMLAKIERNKAFSSDMDISELDFDDAELSDLVIGGKVKVLIQDLNIEKLKTYLSADRKIIAQLLQKCQAIHAGRDAKLQDLKAMMADKVTNPINAGNKKIIVFSAFADTVKYLYEQCADEFLERYGLRSALVTGTDVNRTNLPGCKHDLNSILVNFSPLSKSRAELFPDAKEEIDLLFCTDCISEGQNLQDCDYLINYDIHWNPVRIIQRFGRIDRIGSRNEQIQLVNFYPHRELDQYIDLVKRVKGRMQILDISATGDDNVIDERAGQQQDLDYRMRQLERMKETVVDLEDLEGGISISDLTFNDFKIDADRVTDEEQQAYNLLGPAVFALVENNLVDHPAGVLFCLKDHDDTRAEEKLKTNLLHPYSLVYVTPDGEVAVPARLGKKALDLFKKLAYGRLVIDEEQLKAFNLKTKSGKFMGEYVALLDAVKQHLSGEEKEAQALSIFNPEGSSLGIGTKPGNYEVISYLIVSA